MTPMDPLEVASSIVEIHASGLFDEEWYGRHHGDTAWPSGGGLVHWCTLGWRAGHRPNFYFDTRSYLEICDASGQAGLNPLTHYIRSGEASGLPPGPHFDADWYRARHAIGPRDTGLGHYLRHRRLRLHGPSPGFDPSWYAAENPDVVAGGHDLFEHWVLQGRAEGRAPTREAAVARDMALIEASGLFDRTHDAAAALASPDGEPRDPLRAFCEGGWRRPGCHPNPLFDVAHYLRTNPDVAASGRNPLVHYIAFGEAEDRTPSAGFDPVAHRRAHGLPDGASAIRHALRAAAPADAPPPDPDHRPAELSDADLQAIAASGLFDETWYLINYPDVRACGADPLAHFCAHGWREGRRPNPYFDPDWYARTQMAGSAGAGTNPLLHYLRIGEPRALRPIAYFDPGWYRATHGSVADAPLAHFLSVRRQQTHSPVPEFDVAWYLERHGPTIGRNRDPFAHYLREGITRDLDPGPDFDASAWREAHMERAVPPWRGTPGAEIHERLRREILNPLVHFLTSRHGGGRDDGAAAAAVARAATTQAG